MNSRGVVRGESVGDYEGFNIGASTFNQLRRAGIVPDRSYASKSNAKPDALVVDRRATTPQVVFVVEYKDQGELDSEAKQEQVFDKVTRTYCCPLDASLAAVTDGRFVAWLLVDCDSETWRVIEREDSFPLDVRVDLGTPAGRKLVGKTLERLRTELDQTRAKLVPVEAVNPTRLAEQTWQTIWLASGENPDACLATFVEILIFKFLSDLGILTNTPSGTMVDFDTVRDLGNAQILRYYFQHCRPETKRLFPPSADGTSVINGIVLKPDNVDHGRLFAEILSRFAQTGTLRRIDPEFKSRIFERFLKKSISQKNWGQFFTPRNVVKAMVEMSGIENLSPGAVVADPACGVGGFLLEPLVHKRPHDLRAEGTPSLAYRGFDRDPKTVILAKANMLIHLSEVLEQDPSSAPSWLAPVLNETFHSQADSITGSLSLAPKEEFDLVMTNPPYVVAGTSTIRRMISEEATLSAYYTVPGSGVENLFLQLIIAGLKPGARGLVVVPDGLLLRHTEEALKRHVLRHCKLEAIVSLPKDTFYSTPKKTYVLVFRKKLHPDDQQTDPVFTYLASKVGETLDAKRFPIEENDLPQMAEQFKLFQGSPSSYTEPDDDLRLKIWPLDKFAAEQHWLVDRWWSQEELQALGVADEPKAIGPEQLSERLTAVADSLRDLSGLLVEQESSNASIQTRTVCLGDSELFRLSIGERVLKKELHGKKPGPIPLYSANVAEPFGFVCEGNIEDFSRPSVLWGIDGDFKLAVKETSVEFATTDHCGRIEILLDDIVASYCRAAIALARVYGFDRTLRPSLKRMRELEFQVPVKEDGTFDPEAQRALASRYDAVVSALGDAERSFVPLLELEPDVLMGDTQSEEDG